MTIARMPRASWALVCLVALSSQPCAADEPVNQVEIRSEDGKVVIAADQIRSYDWATHTLTLAPKVRDELSKKLIRDSQIISGIPFAMTVDGQAIYKGKFTSCSSSRTLSTVTIVIDMAAIDPKLKANQLRIQLGYPGADFFKGDDPRADKRLKNALDTEGKLADTPADHTEWIAKGLREMQTIKAGATRRELLKVFKPEEGGLSNRLQRRYCYHECPYIKVDVKFEAVGNVEDKLTNSPDDKITQISTPFLEWTIAD